MPSITDRLAVAGGQPLIPQGTIRSWPPIDQQDRDLVLASLDGGKHAFGPNCSAFQREFANWNGCRHAVFTNSGTAALHMGLAACGVGAGDHVLVTAYSWSSSATCIIHHNAIPIFVDIDFDTINLDVTRLEAAITPRTKAIVCVHLHGLAVDMDAVMSLARRRGLRVIEDACQSHGATYNGRQVGTFGDCAAFSFNQNKSLCTGEGGMFVTNDDAICAAAQMVWSFGETRTPNQDRDYHAYALGWMYRGSDLVAAFGRAQLRRIDAFLQTQRDHAAVLRTELQDVAGLIQPTAPRGHDHTYYNYTIRIDSAALGWNGPPAQLRDAIVAAIQAEGAPVSVWQRFMLPEMTIFRAKNAYGGGCPWSCPLSGAAAGKDVVYDPEQFPNARRHCDSYFGMTTPLRSPNGPEAPRSIAAAIRKVMTNLDQLLLDQAPANG